MKDICLKFFIVFLAIFWGHPCFGSSSQDFIFPRAIVYRIIKNGNALGKCQLKYLNKVKQFSGLPELSVLRFRGFEGFGWHSHVAMISYFYPLPDFSFFDFQIWKNGNTLISEARRQRSILGGPELTIEYRDIEKNLQISPAISSTEEIKYVDFLSLFILSSYAAFKRESNFDIVYINLKKKIIETKPMTLLNQNCECSEIVDKVVPTQVWSLHHSGEEFIRFNIRIDSNGLTYPFIITIKDGSDVIRLETYAVNQK